MFSYTVINGTDRTIFVPDYRFKRIGKNLTLVPMRGYGYMLAVFCGNTECLGYVDVVDLGYANVKEWMVSNG